MTHAVAVSSPKSVSLRDGHDSDTAQELLRRFKEAQNAGRRIVSFGLFAWEIKTSKLKHGQWGPWLAAHCPQLCRDDGRTGRPKPSSSLSTYMQMTSDILEDMGFSVHKYFAHISNSQQLGICHGGKFLLLPDKKLSPPARELKQGICNRVDGKTAKQIRLAFGQVEEDASGKLKPKRGRLKGQGGASAEQRAKAAAREEAARLEAIELDADDFCAWLDDNLDDQRLGQISDAPFNKLLDALETAVAYMTAIRKARRAKGGKS